MLPSGRRGSEGLSASVRHEVVAQCGKFKPGVAPMSSGPRCGRKWSGRCSFFSHMIRAGTALSADNLRCVKPSERELRFTAR